MDYDDLDEYGEPEKKPIKGILNISSDKCISPLKSWWSNNSATFFIYEIS